MSGFVQSGRFGGAPAGYLFHDTFTGSAGALNAHTPDVDPYGAGWTAPWGGAARALLNGSGKATMYNEVAMCRVGQANYQATILGWDLQYGAGSFESPVVELFNTQSAIFDPAGILVIFLPNAATTSIEIRTGGQAGTHLSGSPHTCTLNQGIQDMRVETDGATYIKVYRSAAGADSWTLLAENTDATVIADQANDASSDYFGLGAFGRDVNTFDELRIVTL